MVEDAAEDVAKRTRKRPRKRPLPASGAVEARRLTPLARRRAVGPRRRPRPLRLSRHPGCQGSQAAASTRATRQAPRGAAESCPGRSGRGLLLPRPPHWRSTPPARPAVGLGGAQQAVGNAGHALARRSSESGSSMLRAQQGEVSARRAGGCLHPGARRL